MDGKQQSNRNEAEEANKIMSKDFKDYGARFDAEPNSEVEKANQEIQQVFYREGENNNLLPFHVDMNNPPIKK